MKIHVTAILRVLNVANRTEAAALWVEENVSHSVELPNDAKGLDLVVLPFRAYSLDPTDAVLADGLTEDVTSLLARVPGVAVAGRGTAEIVQSENRDSNDALRAHAELGVRYVVEGSVRRTSARIRVNVRLVSAESGEQLWADRWDRSSDELFAVEDELIAGIAGQLSTELTQAAARRVDQARPEDLGAWEYYQRALVAFHYESFTKDNALRALELIDCALEIEPEYAYAHAMRGMLLAHCVTFGWSEDADADFKAALAAGQESISRAPDDPLVLQHWGSTVSLLEGPAKSVFLLQRSLEGDPSSAHAWALLGLYLARSGSLENAAAYLERAFALSPRDPRRFLWHEYQAVVAIIEGDWARVADRCETALSLRNDQPLTWATLSVMRYKLGQDHRDTAKRAEELQPDRAFYAALQLIRVHRPEDEASEWKKLFAEAKFINT